MKKNIFKGAWCPSVTPFDAKGKIDFLGLEKHLARISTSGIQGVLLMGSIGEFATLSLAERIELMQKARKMSTLPMIAHISSTCVDEIVEMADIALSEGYEAVMILPHYYYAQTPTQLVEYYKALDQRIHGKWFIYNFPARTGCDVTADIVVTLAESCPNFVGIKDTVDCSSHTRAIVRAVKNIRDDFTVFAGFDEYFIPNLMNGGEGVLSGLNNVVPELFAEIYQAYQDEDFAKIAKLHQEIGRLMAIYSIGEDFVTTIKTAVGRLYGYMDAYSRNYGGALNQKHLVEIDQLFHSKK